MDKEALLKLKTEVEEAKTKLAEIKGKEELLMAQLFEKFKCKTLGEAQELLESMKEEIAEEKKAIEKATAELEEKYEFE